LKENGQLRGCIGSLRASRPLAENVISMARSAATEDPRFQPVSEQELNDLEYEISVLTPLQILEDPYNVRVGIDGLVIVGTGGRSGVLLPQVPVEQGWNREEFLSGVCRKAGLDPDAYNGNVVLYRFQAQIINEDVTDSQQQL
jgi:AmmeMemoRadiSam system protein A